VLPHLVQPPRRLLRWHRRVHSRGSGGIAIPILGDAGISSFRVAVIFDPISTVDLSKTRRCLMDGYTGGGLKSLSSCSRWCSLSQRCLQCMSDSQLLELSRVAAEELNQFPLPSSVMRQIHHTDKNISKS
jgi:hypothetical protein